MLNHARETLLALVMILSSFLGYRLARSVGGPGRPLRTKTRSKREQTIEGTVDRADR
jgi:hypothetical protein